MSIKEKNKNLTLLKKIIFQLENNIISYDNYTNSLIVKKLNNKNIDKMFLKKVYKKDGINGLKKIIEENINNIIG